MATIQDLQNELKIISEALANRNLPHSERLLAVDQGAKLRKAIAERQNVLPKETLRAQMQAERETIKDKEKRDKETVKVDLEKRQDAAEKTKKAHLENARQDYDSAMAVITEQRKAQNILLRQKRFSELLQAGKMRSIELGKLKAQEEADIKSAQAAGVPIDQIQKTYKDLREQVQWEYKEEKQVIRDRWAEKAKEFDAEKKDKVDQVRNVLRLEQRQARQLEKSQRRAAGKQHKKDVGAIEEERDFDLKGVKDEERKKTRELAQALKDAKEAAVGWRKAVTRQLKDVEKTRKEGAVAKRKKTRQQQLAARKAAALKRKKDKQRSKRNAKLGGMVSNFVFGVTSPSGALQKGAKWGIDKLGKNLGKAFDKIGQSASKKIAAEEAGAGAAEAAVGEGAAEGVAAEAEAGPPGWIALAAQSLAALAVVVVGLPLLFRNLGDSVLNAQRQFAELSPALASVFLQYDMQKRLSQSRIGNMVAGTAGELADSQVALMQALEKPTAFLQNIYNILASKFVNALTWLTNNVLTPLLEYIKAILKYLKLWDNKWDQALPNNNPFGAFMDDLVRRGRNIGPAPIRPQPALP